MCIQLVNLNYFCFSRATWLFIYEGIEFVNLFKCRKNGVFFENFWPVSTSKTVKMTFFTKVWRGLQLHGGHKLGHQIRKQEVLINAALGLKQKKGRSINLWIQCYTLKILRKATSQIIWMRTLRTFLTAPNLYNKYRKLHFRSISPFYPPRLEIIVFLNQSVKWQLYTCALEVQFQFLHE